MINHIQADCVQPIFHGLVSALWYAPERQCNIQQESSVLLMQCIDLRANTNTKQLTNNHQCKSLHQASTQVATPPTKLCDYKH